VKARLTAWLAALLIVSAVIGVPVARTATNNVCCYQVYSERRRLRAEEFSEKPERPRFASPSIAAAVLPQPLPTSLLDHSLFQRPPPASRFARL